MNTNKKKGKFLLATNGLNFVAFIIALASFFLLSDYKFNVPKPFAIASILWAVVLGVTIGLLAIEFLNKAKYINVFALTLTYLFTTFFGGLLGMLVNIFVAPDSSLKLQIGYGLITALPMLFWLYLTSKLFGHIWDVCNLETLSSRKT